MHARRAARVATGGSRAQVGPACAALGPLRAARRALALTAAIVGFGVFSSAVGTGALPTASLPAFGVTNGDGSLSTVAELGDVNGDGYGDYAVGLPSSDAGGADSGIVYVFLGHGGALPATPTAVNLASASFRIIGHGGEMLGYTVVGNDVNNDGLRRHRDRRAHGRAAGQERRRRRLRDLRPRQPGRRQHDDALARGPTNDPTNPATPSPLGSRYDGFQQDSHTGMSLAALPDVNGDGYSDLAVGSPDANLHRPGGGGVAVLYGKPQGVHITLNDLWENGYPYFFHVDFPALDNQHVGASVASVGDMTGDGQPDIAIGAPQADFNGADSGSVWIISAHLPPIVGCTQASGRRPAVCPWIKLNGLTAGAGLPHRRRRGGRSARHLARRRRRPERRRHPRPRDRRGGRLAERPRRLGRGRRRPGPGRQATRDLAVAPPLQTIYGPVAGAGLGASLAAAGDVDGDGRDDLLAGAPGEAAAAGAAYLVRGRPRHDLRPRAGGGEDRTGGRRLDDRQHRRRRFALDGAGADALVAAPGANGSGAWYVVGGSGTPVLPPPPGSPAPPPAAGAAAAPPRRPPQPAGAAATPPSPPATATAAGRPTTAPAVPSRRPLRRPRRRPSRSSRKRRRSFRSARSRSPRRSTRSSRASA